MPLGTRVAPHSLLLRRAGPCGVLCAFFVLRPRLWRHLPCIGTNRARRCRYALRVAWRASNCNLAAYHRVRVVVVKRHITDTVVEHTGCLIESQGGVLAWGAS